MSGAVFDLTEEQWERMEEIYNREREHKTNLSFEMSLAKELPELLEQEESTSGGGGYRENGNSSYGRGGDRGSRRDSGYGGSGNSGSAGGWVWNRNENSGGSNGYSRGGGAP